MRDFTLHTFRQLLSTLKEQQYTFLPFATFLRYPSFKSIILRHDVDARRMNSLNCARLEKELGITGTYYFRIVQDSFNADVIKEIADLGHEIGYHYEDVSFAAQRHRGAMAQWRKGLKADELIAKIAIESFKDNLERLRRIVPVKTICMHGSPMSRWDNQLLWKYYDYRDFGLIGEPYFDINFEEVLYLTDTGRRWDGDSVNIRDKAEGNPSTFSLQPSANSLKIHSTFDIIDAAKRNRLPGKMMITIHPQRWDNRSLPWIHELLWQNIKNVGKRIISGSR